RTARAEIEEEVALEEEPGPDHELGVGPDRPADVADGERDLVRVAVALGRDDLADVDAGDPNRRVDGDHGRVAEDRLQLVAVAGERDVLGVGEDEPDRGEDDDREADQPWAPAIVAAEGALVGL